ncbi:MAG: hypothetical protein J0H69_19770 [Burkholderiales bacterium]|nr:hypothetical protein [Burkholderiales bacterium]
MSQALGFALTGVCVLCLAGLFPPGIARAPVIAVAGCFFLGAVVVALGVA